MDAGESHFRALAEKAAGHIRDVLSLSLEHFSAQGALVLFDAHSELSRVLTEAYRRCLPDARFVDIDSVPAENFLAAFAPLRPGDLAVLIQSHRFRPEVFRVRIELFKRGLKVVEHPHLDRVTGVEAEWYADALAYDADYYRGIGARLKARLDAAPSACIEGDGERLAFDSRFEPAKLNVGDYRGMPNVGGQFPIGEIFTEAQNLEAVHGRLPIFAFADLSFRVNLPERPVVLTVEKGRVIAAENSTPEFEAVLAAIRADEGEVRVRELGFGLNRAFGPGRVVSDAGTFERACGVHLSLGAKHAVYPKPGLGRRSTRHHVDVFAQVDAVYLGEERVFCDGRWMV